MYFISKPDCMHIVFRNKKELKEFINSLQKMHDDEMINDAPLIYSQYDNQWNHDAMDEDYRRLTNMVVEHKYDDGDPRIPKNGDTDGDGD